MYLSKDVDYAWAAGLWDGEGCTMQGGTQNNTYAIQMAMSQSSKTGVPDVLRKFRRIVGAGNITGPYYRPQRNPIYRWTISQKNEVRRILRLLWPFLGTRKRRQARYHLQKLS